MRKPKTFKIGKIELDLLPRSMEDFDLAFVLQEGTPQEKGEASKELIRRMLKEAVPDATEEELKEMAMPHAAELSKAFAELNGLNVETSK
jgi:hypothetical protein